METAYLTPDVLARPNLKVATGAFVNRILFDGNQDAPRAVGVEFNDKHGGTFRVKALKEVIVAYAIFALQGFYGLMMQQ